MVQLCSLGLVIQEQAAGLDHDSPTVEYVGNGPEACVFILPFSMRKEYSWSLFVERTIDLWYILENTYQVAPICSCARKC